MHAFQVQLTKFSLTRILTRVSVYCICKYVKKIVSLQYLPNMFDKKSS